MANSCHILISYRNGQHTTLFPPISVVEGIQSVLSVYLSVFLGYEYRQGGHVVVFSFIYYFEQKLVMKAMEKPCRTTRLINVFTTVQKFQLSSGKTTTPYA